MRLLLNEESAALFGPNLGFYVSKGLFVKYDSFAALAEASGMAAGKLARSVSAYNRAAESDDVADEFGKSVFPVAGIDLEGAVYSAEITPVIHYTMGGVQMSGGTTRVIDMSGDSIPGLFAAGEVTGGVHGKNRLAGNSLLECVVFGRIAGHSALRRANAVRLSGKTGHTEL